MMRIKEDYEITIIEIAYTLRLKKVVHIKIFYDEINILITKYHYEIIQKKTSLKIY